MGNRKVQKVSFREFYHKIRRGKIKSPIIINNIQIILHIRYPNSGVAKQGIGFVTSIASDYTGTGIFWL